MYSKGLSIEAEHGWVAQLIHFRGPRSPRAVRAGETARRERFEPLLMAHPQTNQELVAVYVLRQSDGTELTLAVACSESALDVVETLANSSDLLPGEDPALLPRPDRVERFAVVRARCACGAAASRRRD